MIQVIMLKLQFLNVRATEILPFDVRLLPKSCGQTLDLTKSHRQSRVPHVHAGPIIISGCTRDSEVICPFITVKISELKGIVRLDLEIFMVSPVLSHNGAKNPLTDPKCLT